MKPCRRCSTTSKVLFEGREYFVGDGFSIADLSVVTQLINLELVVGPLSAERWPQLAALVERVKSRPSFGPQSGDLQEDHQTAHRSGLINRSAVVMRDGR